MKILESAKYKKYTNQIINNYKGIFRNSAPGSLYEPLDYFLNPPGKLIRPVLLLASYEAAGGKTGKVINQAVAIELFHNFTLIHDDIMDNADIRHGKLTVHKKFDVNAAILSGDNLLAFSFKKLLSGLKVENLKVIELFVDEIITICEGQSLDKDFETNSKVSVDNYLKMIRKKTASLIEMSCKIGAILADAPKEEVLYFSKFGSSIGMAFQIQDDLLDVFGNQNKLGKKIGSDIREKKKTFLWLKMMELVRGNDLIKIDKYIKSKRVKDSDIKMIIELYQKYDIIDSTKKLIKQYGNNAIKNLDKIKNNPAKDFLIELTEELLERTF